MGAYPNRYTVNKKFLYLKEVGRSPPTTPDKSFAFIAAANARPVSFDGAAKKEAASGTFDKICFARAIRCFCPATYLAWSVF